MPRDVALQVLREEKSDIWSMKSMLDIIQQEIEAREPCSLFGETEKKTVFHRPKQTPATFSSFRTREQSNANN